MNHELQGFGLLVPGPHAMMPQGDVAASGAACTITDCKAMQGLLRAVEKRNAASCYAQSQSSISGQAMSSLVWTRWGGFMTSHKPCATTSCQPIGSHSLSGHVWLCYEMITGWHIHVGQRPCLNQGFLLDPPHPPTPHPQIHTPWPANHTDQHTHTQTSVDGAPGKPPASPRTSTSPPIWRWGLRLRVWVWEDCAPGPWLHRHM